MQEELCDIWDSSRDSHAYNDQALCFGYFWSDFLNQMFGFFLLFSICMNHLKRETYSNH